MIKFNWTQDMSQAVTGQTIGINIGGDFGGGTVTIYEFIEDVGFPGSEIPLQNTYYDEAQGKFVSVPATFDAPFFMTVENGGRRNIIVKLEGSTTPNVFGSITPYVNEMITKADESLSGQVLAICG